MEDSCKLTLKRVELSLTKFNEVAVPYHLDLLRQHKVNILKYEEAGEYNKVNAEQTNARRVASQLRCLLSEMESLRNQVRKEDLQKFDKITQRSRDLTLKAIMEYLETSPLSINRAHASEEPSTLSMSAVSTDSVGVVAHNPDQSADLPTYQQMQLSNQEITLREKEAMLRGWSSLQEEVRALHETWEHMQSAAFRQKELVEDVHESIEVAAVNVEQGRRHLSTAEKIKVGAYGAGGAAVGALVAGPVGLVIGAKAAVASLLAGSVVGYFGGSILGKKRKEQLDGSATTDKQD